MADLNNGAVWSQTDASNNAATMFPEGMRIFDVNDNLRGTSGATKRFYDHINATLTSGGTNTVTLTYSIAPGSLVAGDTFSFWAGGTNTGATTLNINSLGAKAVQNNGAALVGNEIISGKLVIVVYDGTAFQLVREPLNSVSFIGAGQATANWDQAGLKGGSIGLYDSSSGFGNGGCVEFGANGTFGKFAAIKGYFTNGGNNTQGDLVFCVRPVITDATMTEKMRLTSAGTLNLQGSLWVGGRGFATTSGVYNILQDGSANNAIFLGGSGDASNYYRNTVHNFQSIAGGSTYTTIDTNGYVSALKLSTSAQANKFGGAGGSNTSPTHTNTNILLYDNSSTNYAGIGSHTDGSPYIVCGTVTPVTRLNIQANTGAITASGYGTGYVYSDSSGNFTNKVPASYLASPGNPTGSTSLVGVMCGFSNGTTLITPTTTGRLLIIIGGTGGNNTAGCGFFYGIKYGTGNGPANGAAATGTSLGTAAVGQGSNLYSLPFTAHAVVTGLSVGTAYWVDLLQGAFAGGTNTLIDITISIVEM